MVIVKDFKTEFYDEVLNKRVLILVSLDVDALCACKILQYLFQCDHVLYTIVPVVGKSEFEDIFKKHSEGICNVVMIGCGATEDVVSLLSPADDVVFYIVDSHQPVDIHNVYNQIQVKLLARSEDINDLPLYADVFSEGENQSSGSESDQDSDDNRPRHLRKFDDQTLTRRANRRKWREKRTKYMFDYTEFTGYGTSAAIILFELSWKLSKDTNDLLWNAIIGLTSQFINGRIDRDKYIDDVTMLQSHVSKLSNKVGDAALTGQSVNAVQISFASELDLPLYRHWTLYDSLRHSRYMYTHFRIWTTKGAKKLYEFLADMGLPITQCKQNFRSMDVSIKDTVKDIISKEVEKYRLDEQRLFLPSFNVKFGFRNNFSATDYYYACHSVLHDYKKNKSVVEQYFKAYDVLNRLNNEALQNGIESSRYLLTAILRQTQHFMDMKHHIISAGPFLYTFINEGTSDIALLSKPANLMMLAKFTLEAFAAISKNKKVINLPLVMGSPLSIDEGSMIVIGIPPISDVSCKNFFGKAFEQAAQSTKATVTQNSFENNVVIIQKEEKADFFDALISLLH